MANPIQLGVSEIDVISDVVHEVVDEVESIVVDEVLYARVTEDEDEYVIDWLIKGIPGVRIMGSAGILNSAESLLINRSRRRFPRKYWVRWKSSGLKQDNSRKGL